MSIRIVLADDPPLIRAGVRVLAARIPALETAVAVAADDQPLTRAGLRVLAARIPAPETAAVAVA
ncbi:hypothetical protein [Actinomadura sp. 3N508]|uniref:hypothetical protein n=1 Tax=Actinomadura sp. 3N508 TaxID=3375153 RepID=UPI003793AE33